MTHHLQHYLVFPLLLVLYACAAMPTVEEQEKYIDRSGKSRETLIAEFRNSYEMTCLPTYTGECDDKILNVNDDGFSYQYFDTRGYHYFDYPPYMWTTDVIRIGQQGDKVGFSANKEDALRIYGFLMSIYRAGKTAQGTPAPAPVQGQVGTIEMDRPSSAVEYTVREQDDSPPEIVIYQPDVSRGMSVVPYENVKVEGKVSDSDGIYRVIVNGTDITPNSLGVFSANVPLTEGDNTISIVAIDTKMRSSLRELTIRRKADRTDLSKQDRRLALVIGNSRYLHGSVLANPVNDARALKHALEDLGFVVIIQENGTQKTMKRAIDDFGRELKSYDVGLFFFAGHGVQVSGNNFLIPVDARLESESDVEYDAVRADRVLAKMESAGAITNIVILDACRDNPFERGWKRGVTGSGLAFMDAPSGSIIAYATSPGQTASDGSGRNGVYTAAILEHINTENITIEEMFKLVRATIMEETDDGQVPWESTSLRGNFYFKRR